MGLALGVLYHSEESFARSTLPNERITLDAFGKIPMKNGDKVVVYPVPRLAGQS